MMKKYLITILALLIIIVSFVVWRAAAPAKITMTPDHLDMLVSLDGEEDDYYEKLTLRNNGIKIKAEKATWHSDNPDVAEIDRDGWVTSMGVGKATITAEYKGSRAQCVVVVKQKITSDTLGE